MDKKHTRSLSGGRGNLSGHSSEELTIASPAEFVQRFGGKRVIEKVGIRSPQTKLTLLLSEGNVCIFSRHQSYRRV